MTEQTKPPKTPQERADANDPFADYAPYADFMRWIEEEFPYIRRAADHRCHHRRRKREWRGA